MGGREKSGALTHVEESGGHSGQVSHSQNKSVSQEGGYEVKGTHDLERPYSQKVLSGSTFCSPAMESHARLQSKRRCCYIRMPSRTLCPTQETDFVISVRTGHNKIDP
ncbi:hypothetical protein STEG23_030025 [Scotinomys teguina]